jgi:hypothetical protein
MAVATSWAAKDTVARGLVVELPRRQYAARGFSIQGKAGLANEMEARCAKCACASVMHRGLSI